MAPSPFPAGTDPDSLKKDIQTHRDLAALSYIWVLSVLIYVMRRESPFVRFHARQAMILFFVSIPAWFIPYAGRFLELVILAGASIGFLNAVQGECRDVPLVGPLSRGEISLLQVGRELLRSARHLGRQFQRILHQEWQHRTQATQLLASSQHTPGDALAVADENSMLPNEHPVPSTHS